MEFKYVRGKRKGQSIFINVDSEPLPYRKVSLVVSYALLIIVAALIVLAAQNWQALVAWGLSL
jgi:cytoskeletal protein RodZ